MSSSLVSILLLSVVLSSCGGQSSHAVDSPPPIAGEGGAAGPEPDPAGMGGTDDHSGNAVAFDQLVGTARDRNDVAAGEVCERIATIQCAGEASCCDAPGRSFEDCKATMRQGCIRELRLDAITASALTGYDRENAADVFAEYERLARACDVTVAEWGASMNGLRSLTRGTLAPGASCQPPALDLVAMNDAAAAHLFACTEPEEQACLPSVTSWSCKPRSAEGGACFMDMNCLEGLFCTNSKALRIQGGTCNARKDDGSACDFPSDCASLACKNGTCAPRDRQTIFCLQ